MHRAKIHGASPEFQPPCTAGIDKGTGGTWHVRVRVTKVPEGGAKKKLLDAAEILVAAKGFDFVSVRDVTGAAGANVAAVNYHFGSREGLMDMVIAKLLDPLCSARRKALESADKRTATESLVRSYVTAIAETAASLGMQAPLFPRLAGRILALPDEALPGALAMERRDTSALYLSAMPQVRPADWAFFEAGLAQSLIACADSSDLSALQEHWIAFGLRGLCVAGNAKKPEAEPQLKEAKEDEAQGMLFDF
ncbi:TetR family transcriptional regulator [Akkermansiaceae bacterium]|nr:TetR family transcriptional regulator [Akkermansiaceae bacterium]